MSLASAYQHHSEGTTGIEQCDCAIEFEQSAPEFPLSHIQIARHQRPPLVYLLENTIPE